MKRFRKDEDGCQVTTATVKTWIEKSKDATRECLGLKAYIGSVVDAADAWEDCGGARKAKAMKAMKSANDGNDDKPPKKATPKKHALPMKAMKAMKAMKSSA